MAMSHAREIEGYILDGMARALYVHAYMIWATEVEPPPQMDTSWEEMAPNNAATRKASMQAAKALVDLLAEANHLGADHPMNDLFRKVSSKIDADRAYVFGEELALLALGTLDVGDSHFILPPDPSRPRRWDPVIPGFSIELDDDGHALSWDGGVSWERNPRKPVRAAARRRTDDDDDDPSDAEIDAALDRAAAMALQGEETEATVTVTPDLRRALQAYRGMVGDMLSPEGAARARARIDRALSRGRVDPDTAEYARDMASFATNPAKRNAGLVLTALLLEDDPLVQKASTRMIKRAYGNGTIVLVVDSVDAAIATLEVHPEIKLIVSDVDVLGDKSGVELFYWVRDRRPELVDHYIFFTGGHPEVAQVHYRYLEKGAVLPEDFRKAMRVPAPAVARTATPHTRLPLPGAPSMSAQEFARKVKDAIPRIGNANGPDGRPAERFGPKIFISALWRYLQTDPAIMALSAGEPIGPAPSRAFRMMLLDANAKGLLHLARADLVGAMDPTAVADSEIRYMNAEFHFVYDDHDSPASRSWAPAGRSHQGHAAMPSGDTLTLSEFAQAVHSALPSIRGGEDSEGRFVGRVGDAVFINRVWEVLRRDPRFSSMGLAAFKQQLVAAQREGLVVLTRADSQGDMNPRDLRESEIVSLGATFNLIEAPRARRY